MKRRDYLALTGTALLAGCSGDSGGSGSTDTPASTDGSTSTPDPTPTPESTQTPTPEPDVDILYRTCTTVEVTAGAYETVALSLANGETKTFEEGYSATEDFTANSPIRDTVVWTSYGKVSKSNPSIQQCTSTPTPDPYDPQTARKNARDPSYDDFFRNFESYQGEPIRFEWGYIYQSIYEDNYDYYQLEVSQTEQELEGDIAVVWYGNERYLEDDILNPLVGVAEELMTYETVQGNERTIPRIELVYAELFEQ